MPIELEKESKNLNKYIEYGVCWFDVTDCVLKAKR